MPDDVKSDSTGDIGRPIPSHGSGPPRFPEVHPNDPDETEGRYLARRAAEAEVRKGDIVANARRRMATAFIRAPGEGERDG